METRWLYISVTCTIHHWSLHYHWRESSALRHHYPSLQTLKNLVWRQGCSGLLCTHTQMLLYCPSQLLENHVKSLFKTRIHWLLESHVQLIPKWLRGSLFQLGFYSVWHYVLFEHKTFADIAVWYYTAIRSFSSYGSLIWHVNVYEWRGSQYVPVVHARGRKPRYLSLLSICS